MSAAFGDELWTSRAVLWIACEFSACSGVPTAHDGTVLAGVKAEPLRGGLRPALTPTPGGTSQAAIGTPEQTEQDQVPL